jgi:NADPH-dependent curcumin reductase CurA
MNTRQIILQSRPLGAPTLQDFKIEDTTLEEIQSGRCYLKGYTIQILTCGVE